MHEIEMIQLKAWIKTEFCQAIKQVVKQAIVEAHADLQIHQKFDKLFDRPPNQESIISKVQQTVGLETLKKSMEELDKPSKPTKAKDSNK